MQIQTGRELFMFDGFNHWCDIARVKYRETKVTPEQTLAIDAQGRICATGPDFMKAASEGTYPVRVFLLRDE